MTLMLVLFTQGIALYPKTYASFLFDSDFAIRYLNGKRPVNPIQIGQKFDAPPQRGREQGYETISPGQVEPSRWLSPLTPAPDQCGRPGSARPSGEKGKKQTAEGSNQSENI